MSFVVAFSLNPLTEHCPECVSVYVCKREWFQNHRHNKFTITLRRYGQIV